MCFVCARGSSNYSLLDNLPWPKIENGGEPPELYLLTQNDATRGPDGKTANERFCQEAAQRFPFQYGLVRAPKGCKDFNDLTRAGATSEQLLELLGGAQWYDPQTEEEPTKVFLSSF